MIRYFSNYPIMQAHVITPAMVPLVKCENVHLTVRDIAALFNIDELSFRKQHNAMWRSHFVNAFIRKHCNRVSSYKNMYVVNNWKIQDEIKRTLNLPHKYVFFTIKHMYSYVYTKIGTDAVPVIQRKLDANGLVDFFALDYEVEA